MTIKITTAILTILLCGSLLCSCAIMNKENRVLLNALDSATSDSFVTSSTSAKVASSVFMAPAAIGAGAIDMTIITPARAVEPACKNTYEVLWEEQNGSDIRKAMLFLPKSVATPIYFIGSWSIHSLFTTKF